MIMQVNELEDFYTYMEQQGMVRETMPSGFLYRFPDHHEYGHVKVLGDTGKWYYIEHDYESPKPFSLEIQIREQYANIGIIDHFESQQAEAYTPGRMEELPVGARFFINNRYAPRGLMHTPPHVRQRRRSIVIRETAYMRSLGPFLEELQGRSEVDTISLLEQGGRECVYYIREAIAGFADGLYTGQAAILYVESVVSRFFAEWMVQMERIAAEQPKMLFTPRSRQIVQQAIDIILRDLRQVPKVKDIALELGVGKSSLETSFRAVTYRTVAEHIRLLRLEHAVLLLKGGKSIEEVAMEVGYSRSRFTDAFKRIYGIAPAEYQKKLNSAAPF